MNNKFRDFNKIKASDKLKSEIISKIRLEEKNRASTICEQKILKTKNNDKKRKKQYKNSEFKERINIMLNNLKEQKNKRKRRFALVTIFMTIVLSSGIVYAFNNIELFKSYFGESIYLVEDSIFSEVTSASNEDYKLTVEGVLSDGYRNVVVVSIQVLSENIKQNFEEYEQNFLLDKGKNVTQAYNYDINELKDLNGKTKKYYLLNYTSVDEKIDLPLLLYFNKEKIDLFVEIPIANTLVTKKVTIDKSNYKNYDYVPEKIVISPFSVVVTGYEKVQSYQIPNPKLIIVFKNETKMCIWDNKSSDLTLNGSRLPENNKIIISANFEKIINVEMIKSIIVDDVEYIIE